MKTPKKAEFSKSATETMEREAVDVVVVGAGMAGIMAALAAKTADNSVLIIEPSNVLGGQGTAGGVAGFCGDTERVNAPFADLIARLDAQGLITPVHPTSDRRDYDLEWCAFFLQEMVRERGIQVLLHARVVDAEAEDGTVISLTVATAGGLIRLDPGFVIDASGACVVPVLTGFPVMHEGANKQLPMSLYFTMWKSAEPVKPFLPPGCPLWTNDREIPMTSLHLFPSGKVEVKMKVVGFDAADGRSLSEAEMFARRQMHGLIYYLQTHGYKDVKLDQHVLASVSRAIGVREERRIVGEHVLTEAEARRAVIFPDAVAVNTYHLDFHWPDRAQRAGTGVLDMLDPHHLPLRMMIPKGAKNLLVPGRGASADQMAMSAFRVMAVVAQMGFAAGHAARLCREQGADLTTLDVPTLQQALAGGGQDLNLSHYGRYLRRAIYSHAPFYAGDPGFSGLTATALEQLDNGRFLAAWTGSREGEDGIWVAERREKHWSAPRRISKKTAAGSGLRLLREADGTVILSGEDGSFCLCSHDDGRTWDEDARPAMGKNRPAARSLPPDHAGPSAAVVIDDGRLALVYVQQSGALTVALSPDEGETWPHVWDIVAAADRPALPTMVATRVGMAIFYLKNETQPAFWQGSVERIIDGPHFVETTPLP